MSDPIVLGRLGETATHLLPAMVNRHGLITGATGTGKTVTLQVLAEAFSARGIPVFMADIKGDLTGLAQAGTPSPKMLDRLASVGMPTPAWRGFPVVLWDVFGTQGHPLRATVSEMGPVLLARMLSLNETQAGVLALVFKVADDEGQLLLDLKDLRAMLADVADRAATLKVRYGNVSAASVGAIQRTLLALETEGAASFFGEPMLDIDDLMASVSTAQGGARGGAGSIAADDGRSDAAAGQAGSPINILAADKLVSAPRIYAVFLLWLLAELYEKLPEAGDLDQPKLVFFFDEAHLLFSGAPPVLLEKIEQVVRLIRSKAVGVWFVTQNPADIPDTVLGQLGNRVQHALRAYTPRDEQAVKVAARTMRPNPGLDIETAMTELAVGEALISCLDEKGRPTPTVRTWVVPPASRIGPIDSSTRQALRDKSAFAAKYDQAVDRESAYEVLAQRAAQTTEAVPGRPAESDETTSAAPGSGRGPASDAARKHASDAEPRGSSEPQRKSASTRAPAPAPATRGWRDDVSEVLFGRVGPRGGRTEGLVQTTLKTSVRTATRAIVRGLLGSFKGGKR